MALTGGCVLVDVTRLHREPSKSRFIQESSASTALVKLSVKGTRPHWQSLIEKIARTRVDSERPFRDLLRLDPTALTLAKYISIDTKGRRLGLTTGQLKTLLPVNIGRPSA